MPVGEPGLTVPPHDFDAETSVLAGLLIGPESAVERVLDILSPDDFYRENHGLMYRAALGLFREGDPIDTVTLGAELGRHGLLKRIGGRAYLVQLQESVPTMVTAARLEHYAQIVRDRAVERRMMAVVATSLIGVGVRPTARERAEARLLDYLARLLPAAERARFVAEEKGNLGGCQHWWEGIDYLVGVTFGTPRLAWMMRRKGRRRRA
jgi:replicative DNA helicase